MKVVKARKEHTCSVCGKIIHSGEHYFRKKGRSGGGHKHTIGTHHGPGGGWYTEKFCEDCGENRKDEANLTNEAIELSMDHSDWTDGEIASALSARYDRKVRYLEGSGFSFVE